jgi:hypothetical protein
LPFDATKRRKTPCQNNAGARARTPTGRSRDCRKAVRVHSAPFGDVQAP